MNGLLQDIRYALRQLHQHRGYAAAAVISMALGIGSTAAEERDYLPEL